MKIAISFPEIKEYEKAAIMECFIFLQQLNITDQIHKYDKRADAKTWHYRKMFDYSTEDQNKQEFAE